MNEPELHDDERAEFDRLYRQLLTDARMMTGPGGQPGTTLQSSVAGSTPPTAGSSDQPLPGPEPTIERPDGAKAAAPKMMRARIVFAN